LLATETQHLLFKPHLITNINKNKIRDQPRHSRLSSLMSFELSISLSFSFTSLWWSEVGSDQALCNRLCRIAGGWLQRYNALCLSQQRPTHCRDFVCKERSALRSCLPRLWFALVWGFCVETSCSTLWINVSKATACFGGSHELFSLNKGYFSLFCARSPLNW